MPVVCTGLLAGPRISCEEEVEEEEEGKEMLLSVAEAECDIVEEEGGGDLQDRDAAKSRDESWRCFAAMRPGW